MSAPPLRGRVHVRIDGTAQDVTTVLTVLGLLDVGAETSGPTPVGDGGAVVAYMSLAMPAVAENVALVEAAP